MHLHGKFNIDAVTCIVKVDVIACICYEAYMSDLNNKKTHEAWARLMRVSGKLLQNIESNLKTSGLPPLAWYDVLLEVRNAQPNWLRPIDIQEKMLIQQYNISRLIERLVKENYVERKSCDCDKRGLYIVLTPQGKNILDKMLPIYKAAIEKHFGSKLNANEVNILTQILNKF